MQTGLKLYGGFAGGETNLSERNWTNNVTTIIGSGDDGVFYNAGYSMPIDSSARLDGFVITSSNSAAIYNFGASPTIANCVFENNKWGGIYSLYGSSPTITNCVFRNNTEYASLENRDSSPLVVNCVFTNNTGAYGTVSEGGSSGRYVGCKFLNNSGQFNGAVKLWAYSATAFERCIFNGNTSSNSAGAVLLEADSAGSFTNCLMANNRAQYSGGFIESDGALSIVNCTLSQNSALYYGGGLYQRSGTATVINSIFWNNEANDQSSTIERKQICSNGGSITVSHSIVNGLSIFVGSGNVPYDPLFVNPASGNFALPGYVSPAQDAGLNSAVNGNNPDLAGNARIALSTVDIGAYESQVLASQPVYFTSMPSSQSTCVGNLAVFTVGTAPNGGPNVIWEVNTGGGFTTLLQDANHIITTNSTSSTLVITNASQSMNGRQFRFYLANASYDSPSYLLNVSPRNVIYVKANATGTQTGTDWTNAYTTLQAAVAAGDGCSEIWVASGTYTPNGNQVEMKAGMKIYGGFAGTETNLSQRNWTNNISLLQGDETGGMIYNRADSGPAIDRTAVLDGFTVVGFNRYSGIENMSASPTIRNCRFVGNPSFAIENYRSSPFIDSCAFVTNFESTVYNTANSSPFITNCLFIGNSGAWGGSAIENRGGFSTVVRCQFVANSARYNGGAVLNDSDGEIEMVNCVFSNNTVNGSGGALANTGGDATLKNCLFYHNSADNAGAVANAYGNLTLIHCTIADNSGVRLAGGVRSSGGQLTVRNSIIWGNTHSADWGSVERGQIYLDTNSPATISHSCIEALSLFAGSNNIPYNPLFINQSGGNLHVPDYSPTINAGSNVYSSAIGKDLDGNDRIYPGQNVDMGVYELGYVDTPLKLISLPASQSACVGNTVTFTAQGDGNFDGLRWAFATPANTNFDYFYSNLGGNRFNGPLGGDYYLYTNGSTITLVISNITATMDGYRFRAHYLAPSFATLNVNPPSIMYVNAAASANGDGSTWATAHKNLQAAIAAANECRRVIWVAAGTYFPTNAFGAYKFSLPEGLQIYGGFAGTETNLSQRNLQTNLTILSGDTGIIGVASDNSVLVVSIDSRLTPYLASNTVLDGLVIENTRIGIDIYGVNANIRNCIIRSNTATGLKIRQAAPRVENCSFLANSSVSSGGGLESVSSQPSIVNCIFRGNSGPMGGAIFAQSSTLSVSNSVFGGNFSGGFGGAIGMIGGQADVVNSTFSANATVYGNAGGIEAVGSSVNLRNNILWNNEATYNSGEFEQFYNYGGSNHVLRCCINAVSSYNQGIGGSNIGTDPLFVSPISGVSAPSLAGDFHLQPCSPANNVGNNFSADGLTVDLDGSPRFVGTVDIGAYELQAAAAQPLLVTTNPAAVNYCALTTNKFTVGASGTGVGYQWEVNINGFGFVPLTESANFSGVNSATLGLAGITTGFHGSEFRCLITSSAGCSIYSESAALSVPAQQVFVNAAAASNGDGASWGTAFQTLQSALATCATEIWVAAGTYIAPNGGFAMKNGVAIYGGFTGTEQTLQQRNWQLNQTVIHNNANIYAFHNFGPLDNSARLDGFIIEGCNYGESDAGIRNESFANVLIENCVFRNNRVGLELAGSSATIRNCLFETNGAVRNTVSISDNGGGIFTAGGTPLIDRCVFRGNSAALGGGIRSSFGANAPQIVNCLFAGNYASSSGAAISHSGSGTLVIRNSTIAGNRSFGSAGYAGGSVSVFNTIIWNNTDNGNTASEMSQFFSSGTVVISNSCLQYLSTVAYQGNGNVSVDPMFAAPISATAAPTLTGDYHLTCVSPMLNAGNTNHIAGQALDLEGNTRVFFGGVDIGAYELQTATATFSLLSQPQDQFGGSNDVLALAVTANDAGATYQWQVSHGGGSFSNLASNATYSGVTTAQLSVTNLNAAMDGDVFRCQLLSPIGCELNSKAVTFTFTPSLGEAVEASELTWTTGGNANWMGQIRISHDAVDSAQSRSIGDSQDTWMETTVVGPGALSFWWKVSSANNDFLEFYTNGVLQAGRITGEVDWSQKTYTLQAGDTTLRWRYAKNASGTAGQDKAWVDQVVFAPNVPAITAQPASQTVAFGDTVIFSVGAAGQPPLSYQWRSNSVNIVNATNSTYVINNAQYSSAATYSVQVSNGGGSTLSSNAVLTVLAADPPVITAQPINQFGTEGLPTTFAVSATGFGPLHYQWKFNSTNIAGANGSSYTIGSVQPNHAGNYSVFITNRFGTALSTNASLNVFTLAEAVDATNFTWATGGNAIWLPQTNVTFDGIDAAQSGTISDNLESWLQTTVTGPGIINFRWKVSSETNFDTIRFTVDGAAQLGGVASGEVNWALKTYSIGAGTKTLRWRYSKDDTVSKGADKAWVDNVSFFPGPVITAQPTNFTVVISNAATFSVTATGSGLGYQWRFNNNPIAGATNSSYSIPSAVLAHEGNYSVVITNAGGSAISSSAALTVLFAPVVATQPQPQTVVSGYDATFNVSAVGRNPLSYQWRKNATPISGATASTFTVTQAQSIDGGNYSVEITNVDGSVVSSDALLTVLLQTPSITTQPQGQTVVLGSAATFNVTATGSIPMSYQWLFNNVNIPNANASSYTIPNAGANSAGSYSVRVSNDVGFTDSQSAQLNVLLPPVFTLQPQSLTVTQGSSFTLSSAVSGTAPFNFQWQLWGADVPGATSSNYFVANATTNHAGRYILQVANAAGTNSSVAATVTVLVPPTILVQPVSQSAALDATVNFEVTAAGTMPLTYQWKFNGMNIAGATTNVYTITNAALSDIGSYTVAISNIVGSVTSSPATLTVATIPPSITTQPVDQTVAPGQSASFSVVAEGSQPLSFQWKKNGIAITGATTASYNISNAQPIHGGGYVVEVSNGAGSLTSANAVLTVTDFANTDGIGLPFIGNGRGNPYPAEVTVSGLQGNITKVTATVRDFGHVYASEISFLLVGPQGQKVVLMANAGLYFNVDHIDMTFDDSASDQLPLTSPLYGGTFRPTDYDGNANLPSPAPARPYADTLSVFNGASANGTWSLYVGDNYPEWDGGYINGGFSLHFETDYLQPPAITQQPVQYLLAAAGSNVTFSVSATSSIPISYQWKKNGVNVAGATNAVCTLNNVQPGDSGTYTVIASNNNGSVISSNAVLDVKAPPTIVNHPQGQSTTAGAPVTFNVTAAGDAPLSYQWYKNGGFISGATESSYSIANVIASDNGDYRVVVTNIVGSATSSNATLVILSPPLITVQPQGRTNNAGTTTNLSVTAIGTAPLQYQWRLDGVNIQGATGSTYNITNLQPVHGGLYSVAVSNAMGVVTSSDALVRVNATNYLAGLPQLSLGGSGAKVNCMKVQDDGKLIIGGFFTSVNGVPRNMIARFNTDGTLDMTWNPQASGQVFALAVSGTNVFIGGQFNFVGGILRQWLAQVSIDGVGTLNTNWAPTLNGPVRSLAVNGSDLYAGGLFNFVSGQPRERIVKLDANTGALDLNWNPGANNTVFSIVTAGTNVYAGGGFTTFGGQTRNRLAKIGNDGLLDTTWNPSADNEVQSMILKGSDLYVSGWFDNVGGQARGKLAKLDATGTGAAFASWANPQMNSGVFSIALLHNDIYAGGWFSFAGSVSRSRLAKFNATTGVLDPLWNPNSTGGSEVVALAADGQTVYAGGNFTKSGIFPRFALARYVMSTNAPSIAQQPQNVAVLAGNTASFTVGANGTELLTYLWRKGGSTILVTTNSSLTITNVQLANTGVYSVMVTNTNGTALSLDAMLTLAQPITLTCASNILVTVDSGAALSDPIDFQSTAAGTPTPTLTYRLGSTAISSPYTFPGGTNVVSVTASNGSSPDATCSFQVIVNRKPAPASDQIVTRRNQAATVSSATLVSNDLDPDNNVFSLTSVSETSTNGGTVVFNSGNITYTPVNAFSGQDRFTYTIEDIHGGSSKGTVVVTVAIDNANVSISRNAGNFTLKVTGTAGLKYVVEKADSLVGPWTPVSGTLTANPSGIITFEDTNAAATTRFYRTVGVP